MSGGLKRTLFFLSAAAVLAVVTILTTATVLYFRFPSRWAGNYVARYIERQTGAKVTIGPVSPFPLGRFSIGSISVTSPSGTPILEIESIRFQYRPLPLLRQHLIVKEFIVDRPKIHLLRDTKGWNCEPLLKLVPPPQQPPPPSPFASIDVQNTPLDHLWGEVQKVLATLAKDFPSVELKEFSVRELQVDFEDGAGARMSAPPLNFGLALTLTPSKRNGKIHLETPRNSKLVVSQTKNETSVDELIALPLLEFDAEWPGDASFKANFTGQLGEMKLALANEQTSYGTVKGSGSLSADLSKGEVEISGPNVSFPGRISSNFSLRLARYGLDSFHARGKLQVSRASGPDALRRFLLGVSGGLLPEIDLDFKADGRLLVPTLAEINRRIATLAPPIEIQADGSLHAKNLPAGLLPNGMKIEGIDGKLIANVGPESATISSSLSLNGARFPRDMTGNADLGSLEIRHNGKIELDRLRRMRIKEATLGIPSLGLLATMNGELRSTIPFPDLNQKRLDSQNPTKLLREALSGELNASLKIDGKKAAGRLKLARLNGRFTNTLALRKRETDRFIVDLQADARDFSLEFSDGTSVQNLDLHFPIHKALYLGPSAAGAPPPSAGNVWTKTYVEQLNALSPYADTLRAGRVTAAGYALDQIQVDAGFDGTNFIVDRFAANLLGGSLWGRFVLLPLAHSLKLSMALEVVNLDMNQLVSQKVAGDAQVSANARAELEVRRGSKLSGEGLLDELQGQFHLTKIGDQALDRMILFLDPKGEDPSMVQARGLLKNSTVASALKNPHVAFAVSHGNMDADIALPGVTLVDVNIPIRGISVKNLLKLGGVRKSIEGLIPLLEMTRYLQLQGIDDQGHEIYAAR
ncbi:MAG TPA: AsmA family protein [Bdellovibrionota bacterium]|nr:AsmA family protein [Bdellovibrionota bacterium]